ncbi:hypothetical protein Tco_0086279 [Tanacetum coccineum]
MTTSVGGEKNIRQGEITLSFPIPAAPVATTWTGKFLLRLCCSHMLQELKALYSKQVEHELLQTVREFHACKQEEGQSVSSYVLKMKSYIDNLVAAIMAKIGHAPNNVPFAPKPKIPPPPKKDNPAKDAICHQCGNIRDTWIEGSVRVSRRVDEKEEAYQGASNFREGWKSDNVSHGIDPDPNLKTTLHTRSLLGFCTETAACILNMVPNKKVVRALRTIYGLKQASSANGIAIWMVKSRNSVFTQNPNELRCVLPTKDMFSGLWKTGYVFILNGGVVNWKSTKQSIFATSSTNAKNIVVFDASNEAVWIRKFHLLGLVLFPTVEGTHKVVFCDKY